jgi:serine/threonine protein phosphatase PrpC
MSPKLALEKDNQDSYIVVPKFGPQSPIQAFFGIFDGHGKDGHYCSRYARDHVSEVEI